MNSRKYTKYAIAFVIFFLIALLTIVLVLHYVENKKVAGNPEEFPSQTDRNVVYYNGEAYKYNYNLKNILFMGIDNNAEMGLENTPGTAGQADCIMLLSMDRENRTAYILQISRDSMTDIDIYDMNGNYYTTIQAQLATQYAYGNGGTSSCFAMKKTVSELLYELPIDGYVAMDIAAVSKINDALGGVTVTIPEDYTAIDPAFVKGETITLNGEQAERYVRYRDITVTGDNHFRMQRQTQYIPALLETFKSEAGDTEEEIKRLYSLVSPYIVTDLTVDGLMELSKYSWDAEQVTFVEGEAKAGEEFEEFYVDDEKLQESIMKMFYKLK